MLFFNPYKLENLPQESGMHEFKILFKNDLRYISSKLEINGTPLGDYLN